MKRFLFAAVLSVAATPVLAADVGVSISIGQPDFYGHIDIGDYPRPQVIYSQPVIVEHVPVDRPPIYLRVPPGHAKHWERHCHEYNACGERVYFVKDDWYRREYVPRYQERHRDHGDGRHDEYRDDRRDHGDGRRDEYRDDHRGGQGKHNRGDRD